MANNIPPSVSDIGRLFNFDEPQPFLLRMLTEEEKRLAFYWIRFYRGLASKDKIFPSAAISEFFVEMNLRHDLTKRLEGLPIGDPGLYFQDLFAHAPRVSVSTALFRLSGCSFMPTETEKASAFVEGVELFQYKHGVYALPKWEDFIDLWKAKVFLPNTGIRALSFASMVSHFDGPNNNIAHFYRKYFRVPEDFTEEQLAVFDVRHPLTDEQAIENYKRVHAYLMDLYPERDPKKSPTSAEVEIHSDMQGGYPWSKYISWFAHSAKTRNLEWLREHSGFSPSRERVVNSPRLPAGYWTPELTRERYCMAWATLNPEGYKPEIQYLADPPTPAQLSRINTQHGAIKKANNGTLPPEVCDEQNVPHMEVPPHSVISRRYPGGQLKLLKDIEDEHCPDRGIVFKNKRQLGQFYRTFKSEHLSLKDVPLAVYRHEPAAPRYDR